jgi:hypothetical protein
MNMICHTTNPIAFTIHVSRNRGEIGVERYANRRVEEGRSIFGAEDHVNKKIGE